MADETEPSLPPLYHACVANDLDEVKRLLEAGADPNDGESVYHSAQLNHRACLEILLSHGANLSSRHATYRNTPLYFLAGHRESERGAACAALGMQWLLEHGADPNVASEDLEETPLHAIARGGWSPGVAELLVAFGAEVNRARADGRTPYVLAVRTGNEPLATFLRARGASTAGVAPVDAFLGACIRGDEPAARAALAANPALVAELDGEDRGVMVQAVHERRDASVRLMAAIGFDPGWEGMWGGTPLHHAAWLGRPTLVKTLLALGAPLNARDSRFGSSPLGWAAHGSANYQDPGADHLAAVLLLLDAGSERAPSINRFGEPPESLAAPEIEQVLRARGFAP